MSIPKMERISWADIPKELIDVAENLLRAALRDEELCFIIQYDVCVGLSKGSLAQDYEILFDWDDLSDLGLMVLVNNVVFHPANFAAFREPGAGISPGFLVADEPWTYAPEVLREGKQNASSNSINIMGWNA